MQRTGVRTGSRHSTPTVAAVLNTGIQWQPPGIFFALPLLNNKQYNKVFDYVYCFVLIPYLIVPPLKKMSEFNTASDAAWNVYGFQDATGKSLVKIGRQHVSGTPLVAVRGVL